MNRSLFATLTVLSILANGCAAQTEASAGSADSDLTEASQSALMDLLTKANAPSDLAPGVLGASERIARVQLTTAQGGMAKFISESGFVSTESGEALGSIIDLGGDWQAVSKALAASGAKWDITKLDQGASSSVVFATVKCSQAVAPRATAHCTITPITLTEDDSTALISVLRNADAPSDSTKVGVDGLESRIGKITVTTSKGGMAKFISEGGSVSTVDGKDKADLVSLSEPWSVVRDAILAGGGVWNTTNGPNGASSSTMTATVECTQVVSPSAKPTCNVTPALP